MTDPAPMDPVERFTGLAEVYARSRPGYPAQAIDYILDRCGIRPGAFVVDVGCGTGIASRLLAARGLRVIGIEPNAEMRARAQATPTPPGASELTFQPGQAESTGLPDNSADAVLSAQAFHWFDAEAALREFHRILKPDGWAILMWNSRDASDPFTAAYGAAIDSRDARHAHVGTVLLSHPLFHEGKQVSFANEQILDEDGFIGRALSVSYAPRDPALVAQLIAHLRLLFAENQTAGKVRLRYTTLVYTAQQ